MDSLKKQGRYENTMIVITGDHEGLADYRDDLCKTKEGYGVVSAEQFVPLVILNAPIGMRYDKVMGQVDIYPTILSLMGLTHYEWQGLGCSILNSNKKQFAVDPRLNIIGDTAGSSSEEAVFAKNAWSISDQLIRYDYFGRKKN
ncbi:MAG: sulfatase-like hydrolase/transferase [Tannerellaceae bacterium]|nr:sulfatase-like hydrolase/transferase [Tannerellaceae bacterium]